MYISNRKLLGLLVVNTFQTYAERCVVLKEALLFGIIVLREKIKYCILFKFHEKYLLWIKKIITFICIIFLSFQLILYFNYIAISFAACVFYQTFWELPSVYLQCSHFLSSPWGYSIIRRWSGLYQCFTDTQQRLDNKKCKGCRKNTEYSTYSQLSYWTW